MKLLLLSLLLFTSVVCVAETTGNDLLDWCKPFFVETRGDKAGDLSGIERIHMGECAGYVSGVMDVEEMWKGVEGKSSKAAHYCLPKGGIPNGQVFRILRKWLDNHPERLHERADNLIHFALIDAFPCG